MPLLAVYFVASLAHFAHNAEYIALQRIPICLAGLPARKVYLAWLALLLASALQWSRHAIGLRFHLAGVLALSAYGGLGLDGLLHYTLALCSEHLALMTNITIWSEAILGLMLMFSGHGGLIRPCKFRAQMDRLRLTCHSTRTFLGAAVRGDLTTTSQGVRH